MGKLRPPTTHGALSPQPVRCRLRSTEARALETAVAEEAVKELGRIQNTSSFWWLLGLTVFLRSLTESISRFTSSIFEFSNFWIYRMFFILKNLKQRHFTNHALVCSAAVTMATILLNPFFLLTWEFFFSWFFLWTEISNAWTLVVMIFYFLALWKVDSIFSKSFVCFDFFVLGHLNLELKV